MDSRVDCIGVVALVGVGLIVPIQAEDGSLDVATFQRASNACAVLSAFASAAATPQTPEEPTPADLREAQRRAREWHAAHPVP